MGCGDEHEIAYQGGSRNSLQSGLRFIYDGETGAIFTRTPSSWAKIGLFYLVYYACLAGFFVGMLSIFLHLCTNEDQPRLIGKHSILPQNPCMGFRPQPDEDMSIIKFDAKDPKSYDDYVRAMTAFLMNPRGRVGQGGDENEKDGVIGYEHGQENLRRCIIGGGVTKDKADVESAGKLSGAPCAFNLTEMPEVVEECLQPNSTGVRTFGFDKGQPCVIIKLNRIIDFVPILKRPAFVKRSIVKRSVVKRSVVEGANINESLVEATKTNNSAVVKPAKTNDSAVVEPENTNNSAVVEPTKTNDSAVIEPSKTNNSAVIEPSKTNDSAVMEPSKTNDSAVMEPAKTNDSVVDKPAEMIVSTSAPTSASAAAVDDDDQLLEIRCEGLHSADEDNIGSIDYYPKPGVDLAFFPFRGEKNYLSPLIFVKFRNVTRNVLVQVACRPVNADNILQEKHSKASGQVQFELMISEDGTGDAGDEKPSMESTKS